MSVRRPRHDGDWFRLSAELSPFQRGVSPNGALFDAGSSHAPITRSDVVQARRYRSRSPLDLSLDGIATVYLGANSDYVRAPYRAHIAAKAGYGNALGSSDFLFGGAVSIPTGNTGSVVRFATIWTANTAAGMAVTFGITAANTLFCEISDGTTIFTLTSSSAGDMAVNGRYYVALVRYKNNLYLHRATLTSSGEGSTRRKLTTIVADGAFVGPVNFPASANISLGANAVGNGFTGGAMYDGWRIRPYPPNGSLPFPVPVGEGNFGLPRPLTVAPVVASAALDAVTTNLWSAVSAWRKLVSSYSGSCLRVRRSSDNTEQDIGFIGKAIDVAALLTFCGTGSGYVTTLYDQSGGGHTWTQTTSGAQPRIVNSGVFDGKLVFDGSDDVLTSSATPGGNSAFSVVGAFTLVPGASGSMIVEHGNSALSQDRFFWQNDPNSPVTGERLFISPSPFADQITVQGTTTRIGRGARYDKTKATSATGCTAWRSNAQLGTSNGPNSGTPAGSGTFNAYTMHMGGRDAVAGSQFGPLMLYDFAVWTVAQTGSDMIAACLALERL